MKKGELFGVGFERSVHLDTQDAGRLIKIDSDQSRKRLDLFENSPNFVKARFYLMKLMHILLPSNIPDIHFAGHSTKTLYSVEKKELDVDHHTIRRMMLAKHVQPVDPKDRAAVLKEYENDEEMEALEEKLVLAAKKSGLTKSLDELLIDADLCGRNFGKDLNGNIIFVDLFEPWIALPDGALQRQYKVKELQQKIETLDSSVREKATHCLNRLEDLFKETSLGQ